MYKVLIIGVASNTKYILHIICRIIGGKMLSQLNFFTQMGVIVKGDKVMKIILSKESVQHFACILVREQFGKTLGRISV